MSIRRTLKRLKQVEILTFGEADTLVVQIKGRINEQTAERVKALIENKFPGRNVLVHDEYSSLKVIHAA